MAPPQPITVIDLLPWLHSTATSLALSELVTARQLAANEDGRPTAWIDPTATDREPNPPYGYVISFVRFHKRGFATPASRFLRGLCFHYGVELHNFVPNAISQAATFVGICEEFLGIPMNWDLWVHLFRAELHTVTTQEPKKRRAVRAGGVTISLRETRRDLYIPCTMISNNADCEWGWFYLRNDDPVLLPWTGKVVREKADSWWHGMSPPSCQDRLDSALKALKALADGGLTAASVLANLHHRRIAPLMERRLRIFEMEETADPVAMAQSRLRHDLFPREYAATRARCAVNLKAMRTDDIALWAFTMLPEGQLVSRVPALLQSFDLWRIVVTWSFTHPLQVMAVNAVRSDPPTPRARACACAAQRREQERVARKKEKGIRRQERRERRSEEFHLREQQGLSSPATSEFSSSDEEEGEESDGGRAPPERWEPSPPSPRAAEAAEETASGAGAGAPAAGHPTGEATRAAEVKDRYGEPERGGVNGSR
jgi:hypothetical protein